MGECRQIYLLQGTGKPFAVAKNGQGGGHQRVTKVGGEFSWGSQKKSYSSKKIRKNDNVHQGKAADLQTKMKVIGG